MTMRQDHPRRDSTPLLLVALIAFTVCVAAVTFVLSFHGLDDYGRRVADLGHLSPLVPLGVDGLTLVAISATSLLRHAPWHIRIYAWFVFAISVALSVAGNLSHALAEDLTWEGEIGSAASPVLLALASHLVIVTLRARERQHVASEVEMPATQPVPGPRVKATRPVAAPHATAGDMAASTLPTPGETRPATPHTPRTPRAKATSGGDTGTTARKMWRAGRSHAEIALALGISKKTAERHTEPLRRAAADSSEREPAAVTA